MNEFLAWVGRTPFSQTLQNELWMVPTIQAVHILALALVFTSALVLNLRLLGVVQKSQSISLLNDRFIPWIGWGVLVLAVTGLLLMISEPTRAILNLYFQIKMAALLIVGGFTWAMAASVAKNPEAWEAPESRSSVRLMAVVSLVLWAVIMTAGRWIAYGP